MENKKKKLKDEIREDLDELVHEYTDEEEPDLKSDLNIWKILKEIVNE